MNRGLIVALVSLCFAASAGATQRRADNLSAHLRAVNEVPSIKTDASGRFSGEISNDGSFITFEVAYSNLTGNLLQAHIHIGQFFANGGVSAFLCGGGGQPNCPTASSGSFSGTITSANVVGPTTQGVAAGELEKVIEAIRQGVTYVNLHSSTFLAGETRGQIRVH